MVIESNQLVGIGPVVSAIVRWGRFTVGSPVVLGASAGRIRRIIRDGKSVRQCAAGDIVQVAGIADPAANGSWLLEVASDADAAKIAEQRKRRAELQNRRQQQIDRAARGVSSGETPSETPDRSSGSSGAPSNETPGETPGETPRVTRIPVVVKADVEGSVEAVKQQLEAVNESLHTAHFQLIQSGFGSVSQSDLDMAHVAKGILLSFNAPITSGRFVEVLLRTAAEDDAAAAPRLRLRSRPLLALR